MDRYEVTVTLWRVELEGEDEIDRVKVHEIVPSPNLYTQPTTEQEGRKLLDMIEGA